MTDINLLKLTFTKNDLKVLEEEEKVFLLQMGGILQEIITLHKLILMSSKGVSNDIERMAENSQAVYFLRLLASTMHEAWKLLEHRKYKNIILEFRKKYPNSDTLEIDKFEKYFSNKNNLCTKIRNNYFYHYNFGKIAYALQKLPSDEQLEIYLSDSHANCRYLSSDIVLNSSMFDVTHKNEFEDKFTIALNEIMEVAKWFIAFSGLIIFDILLSVMDDVKNMGKELTLYNIPNIFDLRLHYFVNSPY